MTSWSTAPLWCQGLTGFPSLYSVVHNANFILSLCLLAVRNCCSVAQSCPTLCNPMDCSTPGFPVLDLPEFAQTHVHWISDAIWPSHPLSPSSLAFNLPSIRVFSHKSALRIRWPKYWSFSFSISPSKEQSGLIFFRIDWFDLLAVQGTLKSLLQHHSLKASILWCSAFFAVHGAAKSWTQLSNFHSLTHSLTFLLSSSHIHM